MLDFHRDIHSQSGETVVHAKEESSTKVIEVSPNSVVIEEDETELVE